MRCAMTLRRASFVAGGTNQARPGAHGVNNGADPLAPCCNCCRASKSGHGTEVYPDGGNYEGGWKNGKEHGKGTLTPASGDGWSGEWKNGERRSAILILWFIARKQQSLWVLRR